VLRKRYDAGGYNSAESAESGVMNAEAFFNLMFGGGRFTDIIGEISLAHFFNDMQQQQQQQEQGGEAGKSGPSEADKEQMEAMRATRVQKLAKTLKDKTRTYVENKDAAAARAELEKKTLEEVNDLKDESYGAEILNAVGFIYALKAQKQLGKESLFGIGAFYHGMREKTHMISGVYSTVKAALDLQSTLKDLEEVKGAEAAQAAQAVDQGAEQQRVAGRGNGDAGPAPSGGDSAAGTPNGGASGPATATTKSGSPSPASSKGKKPVTPEMAKQMEEKVEAKSLKALWLGSKMEVESVIGDVCDQYLDDPESKDPLVRRKRAEALLVMGKIYETAKPSPGREANFFSGQR
jgi:hypothetical protein